MQMMNKTPYLIIGNSAAALGAVDGIRSVDETSPITLIAKESHHTYSRPLISYLLGKKVDDKQMDYRPDDYYETHGIKPILGVEVTKLDAEKLCVETSDGKSIEFEKCLIATGGNPIVPRDVTGLDAEGVFSFTNLDDAHAIRSYIEDNAVKSAVVVGGGLIGLKSVEALNALGIKTTMLELADRILSVSFDQKASEMAKASLEKAGVSVLCETTVSSIAHRGGKVSTIVLRDGASIDAAMIIFAIGVLPNMDFARESGIELDRGIVVDDHMESSVSGVYAAGDVAQAMDMLLGIKRPIPILPTASRQGFIAGCNMAGQERAYEGGLAMNAVDICGLPTISVGQTDPDDDDCEILTANGKEGVYKKVVLKDNRIIGMIFIGQIDRAGIMTGLIKDKVDVSGFKNLLLTDDFGLISLPEEYRKHMVSDVRVAL
jgi:NAD(P)H-nitrite reductase large subunit